VTICIDDCTRGIRLGKLLRRSRSIDYVLCSTVDSKVGTLMDDGASLGVGPCQVGGNILLAEVDVSKLVWLYVGYWKSPRLVSFD
jgi:hypothetical protein